MCRCDLLQAFALYSKSFQGDGYLLLVSSCVCQLSVVRFIGETSSGLVFVFATFCSKAPTTEGGLVVCRDLRASVLEMSDD